MALNVFLPSRKSEEIVTTTPIKIARTEHKNSININKNPAYLDSINKGINSASIDATSPSTNTRTSHEGNTVNKAIKPKVVKLNRRTLGLNVDKSFEHSLLKDGSRSSLNGGTQKVQSHSNNLDIFSMILDRVMNNFSKIHQFKLVCIGQELLTVK